MSENDDDDIVREGGRGLKVMIGIIVKIIIIVDRLYETAIRLQK